MMLKDFGSKTPAVWTNYAHFLHVAEANPDQARALLPRATQVLESRHIVPLTAKFAALEFRSPNGDPERGRTIFENLLSTWPKRFDLWSQLVDLEVGLSGSNSDQVAARDVFERGSKVKGLKPRKAEKWFRRWADWEQKFDPKGKERVLAKAKEWTVAAKARKEAAAADENDESD
jgi:rRNA biogenesis protein RRP5